MNDQNRFPAAMLIPVFLAVLACSAWAGPSGGKGSHYPGQDCSGCHKIRGKSTGKAPATSIPATSTPVKTTPGKITPTKITPLKTTPGTGAPGPKTDATPAKGATQPR
jgi:hypothetical protein